MAKGEIKGISETDEKDQKEVLNKNDVSAKEKFLDIILQMPNINISQIAKILSLSERTIYRIIEGLKSEGKLERVGADKNGFWRAI